MSTWKEDAREAGQIIKGQGGWQAALLIARHVEPGTGGPKPTGKTFPVTDGGKVSANEFADVAGISRPTLLKYYRAWERAADSGYVDHAADLGPDTESHLDVSTLPDWKKEIYPEHPRSAAARRQSAEDLFPQVLQAVKKGMSQADTARKLGLKHDSLPLTRAYGMAEYAIGTVAVPRGLPKNWDGKSNDKRRRELRSVSFKSDFYGLWEVAKQINRLCTTLEDVHFEDYSLEGDDVSEAALAEISQVQDDLMSLGEWQDRALRSTKNWLSNTAVEEKLAKMRDRTGRTEEEWKTAEALADKLELKLGKMRVNARSA